MQAVTDDRELVSQLERLSPSINPLEEKASVLTQQSQRVKALALALQNSKQNLYVSIRANAAQELGYFTQALAQAENTSQLFRQPDKESKATLTKTFNNWLKLQHF